MTKLIDAGEAKKAILKKLGISSERYLLPSEREIVNVIESMPAIDAKPVRHAKLLKAYPTGECSLCGFLIDIRQNFNYCPYCGARLEGKKYDTGRTD